VEDSDKLVSRFSRSLSPCRVQCVCRHAGNRWWNCRDVSHPTRKFLGAPSSFKQPRILIMPVADPHVGGRTSRPTGRNILMAIPSTLQASLQYSASPFLAFSIACMRTKPGQQESEITGWKESVRRTRFILDRNTPTSGTSPKERRGLASERRIISVRWGWKYKLLLSF
jgi:hypothetical protein